jgi:alpha-mannosidase
LTNNNDLFLNVTRSPAYSSSGIAPEKDNWRMRKFQPRQDIGQQTYSYKVVVSDKFDETAITKCADLLNMPIVGQVYFPRPVTNQKNALSAPDQSISVSSQDVIVRAVKKSEKGKKLIIRLLNTTSKKKMFSHNVYGLETPAKLSIKPYELLTVAVKKEKGKCAFSIVNLVEVK